MKTLQTSDFTRKGNEFITKRVKLGFVSIYKKFKAPKKVKINGVGTFNFQSSFEHEVTGKRYIYTSSIDAEITNGNGLRILFW